MNNREIIRYEKKIEEEILLFSKFTMKLDSIKQDVKNKNWQSLEKNLKDLQKRGEKIAHKEEERVLIFRQIVESLGLKKNIPTKEVLAFLDMKLRRKISLLNSRLKIEVIKLVTTVKGLKYYLHTVSELILRILEEVFPYKKGKIYSSGGKPKTASQDPVVINREF